MEPEQQQRKEQSRLKISDGLLAGGITLFGYIVAYLYESGYKSYYHIPSMFIDINTSTVLTGITAIWVIFFLIFGYFNILPSIVPSSNHPIAESFRNLLGYYSVFIIVIIVSGFDEVLVKAAALAAILLLLTEFLLPLLTQRKVKGYLNKLVKSQQKRDTAENNSLLGRATAKFGNPVKILVFILFLLPFVHVFGLNQASSQTNYLIIKQSSTNYVLLHSYKDVLIVAPVDLDKKEITPEFQFIEQKSDFQKNVQYEWTNTGRLTVKEEAKK